MRRLLSFVTYFVAGLIILGAILWRLLFFSDHGDEDSFEYGLAPGMTRQSVVDLEERYHGLPYASGAQPARVPAGPPHAPNALFAFFTDEGMICVVHGKEYILNFDRGDRLVNWTVRPWGGEC